MNIYVWYINNDSCIFGGLDWGNETLEGWGGYIFRFFPIVYGLKILYISKNSNKLIETIANNIGIANNIDMDTKINSNVISKMSEKVLDEISFDTLHNNIGKNIGIENIDINS